jgi:hypothetical protein
MLHFQKLSRPNSVKLGNEFPIPGTAGEEWGVQLFYLAEPLVESSHAINRCSGMLLSCNYSHN